MPSVVSRYMAAFYAGRCCYPSKRLGEGNLNTGERHDKEKRRRPTGRRRLRYLQCVGFVELSGLENDLRTTVARFLHAASGRNRRLAHAAAGDRDLVGGDAAGDQGRTDRVSATQRQRHVVVLR